jgi:hypothetical protein
MKSGGSGAIAFSCNFRCCPLTGQKHQIRYNLLMVKSDFTLEFIKDDQGLRRLAETLLEKTAFSVDIETIEWWNRQRERVALIQLAFRHAEQPKVAVVDALAKLDLNVLRKPFEETSIVKIIHNAAFDAPRLAKHYEINVSPVHDTMLAARASGERKYSLKAQAAIHLGLHLDKSAQRSDWSRRPLDTKQLYYAAMDAHATRLLYENQIGRNLKYDYRLRKNISSEQGLLPLSGVQETENIPAPLLSVIKEINSETPLTNLSAALLGIVAELPTRYSPDSLPVSLGTDRIGLAGWIIDRRLGAETELDEETIKLAIADLCERKLLQITDLRRLEATEKGAQAWQSLKNH